MIVQEFVMSQEFVIVNFLSLTQSLLLQILHIFILKSYRNMNIKFFGREN